LPGLFFLHFANVVLNVTALGGRATLVAVVGDDVEAQRLEERLASEARLACALLRDPQRPTTRKTRVVAYGQQIVRFDRESRRPVEPERARRLVREVESFAASGPGVLVLSGFARGVLTDEVLAGALAVAARHALPVVVDPRRRGFEAYRGATILTPNSAEARAALEAPADTPTEALLEPLLAALGGAALLVTEGERGMTLARGGELPVRIAARGRAVFDRTGAGDTVVAALPTLPAGGAGLEDAAVLAKVAAWVVVGKRGVATVTADEVLAELG